MLGGGITGGAWGAWFFVLARKLRMNERFSDELCEGVVDVGAGTLEIGCGEDAIADMLIKLLVSHLSSLCFSLV